MTGSVRIEGDDLVFELEGIDEFLALKRSIRVPLEHVISVSTENVGWSMSAMKVGGASLPHVVKDGRFLTSDGMMFFEMHNPDKCVSVGLDGEGYKKIVFEVGDKEASATLIKAALASRKRPT